MLRRGCATLTNELRSSQENNPDWVKDRWSKDEVDREGGGRDPIGINAGDSMGLVGVWRWWGWLSERRG